jgi:hypothetical protein
MKTMTRILTVAVVVAGALSLAAPVNANCDADAIITTIDAGGSSFVFSPVFAAHPYFYYGDFGPAAYGLNVPPALSVDAKITFWAVGTGDPAVGFGDDNGAYNMRTQGTGFYYYLYDYGGGETFKAAATLNGNWDNGQFATDGCVGNVNCMCVLFSDHDGDTGFFASVGSQSTATLRTSFNLGGSDGFVNNLPIALVAIDPPSITGSVRDQLTHDVDFTVKVAAPAGVYNGGQTADGACDCAPVGFVVRQQILSSGAVVPSDRDAAAWSLPLKADGSAQTMAAFGTGMTDPGVVIRSACGTSDSDVYLSTQLVFATGFATTVVSGNSLRVECGPTLADPSDRPRPTRPTRGRPDNPRRR